MKPQPSTYDLKRHIKHLLDRFNIEHRIVSRRDPLMWKGVHSDRRIEAPAVDSSYSYLIALHEIGHFTVLSRRGELLDEAAVWIWVRDTAIMWKPEFNEIIAYCLSRYADRVEVSQKIESLLT